MLTNILFFDEQALDIMAVLLTNYPYGKSMVRFHLINEYLKTNSWDTRNALLFTIGNL